MEDLLCITKRESRNIKIGYAQNLAQLESAYKTNKNKWTTDQTFGNNYFDYLYGIVNHKVLIESTMHHVIKYVSCFSHGMALYIIYTFDEGIYCISGSEYQINFSKTVILIYSEAMVKKVIGIIVGFVKDRVSVNNSPNSKRARIKKFVESNGIDSLSVTHVL